MSIPHSDEGRALANQLILEWDHLKEAVQAAEALEGEPGFVDALYVVIARFGPFEGAHARFSVNALRQVVPD